MVLTRSQASKSKAQDSPADSPAKLTKQPRQQRAGAARATGSPAPAGPGAKQQQQQPLGDRQLNIGIMGLKLAKLKAGPASHPIDSLPASPAAALGVEVPFTIAAVQQQRQQQELGQALAVAAAAQAAGEQQQQQEQQPPAREATSVEKKQQAAAEEQEEAAAKQQLAAAAPEPAVAPVEQQAAAPPQQQAQPPPPQLVSAACTTLCMLPAGSAAFTASLAGSASAQHMHWASLCPTYCPCLNYPPALCLPLCTAAGEAAEAAARHNHSL
jgi:hypothetical protein